MTTHYTLLNPHSIYCKRTFLAIGGHSYHYTRKHFNILRSSFSTFPSSPTDVERVRRFLPNCTGTRGLLIRLPGSSLIGDGGHRLPQHLFRWKIDYSHISYEIYDQFRGSQTSSTHFLLNQPTLGLAIGKVLTGPSRQRCLLDIRSWCLQPFKRYTEILNVALGRGSVCVWLYICKFNINFIIISLV